MFVEYWQRSKVLEVRCSSPIGIQATPLRLVPATDEACAGHCADQGCRAGGRRDGLTA
jgi:hypothetical protein